MKIKHLLWLGWAAALVGCTDYTDELPGNNALHDGLKIQISGNIHQQYLSRVDDGGFCGGDQVGLYGVNYTNNNTEAGTLQDKGNQVDNIRYTYDEENMKWTSSSPAYYKDVNTCIDLYAYYPYGAPDNVSEYEFEVAKDQNNNGGYAASDFLWAKAEKVQPSENKVSLRFSHMLSCANVILKAGNNFAEGEFESLKKSVLVLNTTHTSEIDLSTGEATPVGDPSKEGILMMEGADGFRAVVVPQTVTAGKKLFAITVNGITYHFSKDVDFTYTPGMQSKFTLTINKKEMTGEYEFIMTDTEIVEWVADLDTHGGEARQYYVVNQEQPGTLGSLIRTDNKNPNKIKNLKISGIIDVRDFSFMRDSMEILQAINLKETKIVGYSYVWCYIYDEYGNSVYQCELFDKKVATNDEMYALLRERYPNASHFSFSDWGWSYVSAGIIPDNAFKDKKSLVYFTFPEKVTKIGNSAFEGCRLLSGALVIPNDVLEIGWSAFNSTNISSIELSYNLKSIGERAFYGCKSLSGSLLLPESLEMLGASTFEGCNLLSGSLSIPSKIKEIPERCFYYCTGLVGELIIPEGVINIKESAFCGCSHLSGLSLPYSLKKIGDYAFASCGFQGELYVPSLLQEIPDGCFSGANFSSIVFAEDSELLKISEEAFRSNERLMESVVLPKGVLTIGNAAFWGCDMMPKVIIPSMVTTIGDDAFGSCYNLSGLTCEAEFPPALGTNVFSGVPKDNFTLEVPERSVSLYQTANGWNEFQRISAHYDFAISRSLLRALNASYSKTYTLRAPANQAWSIQNKPDWVTISPSNGVGKTEVTVTIGAMYEAEETFETFYWDEWGNKYPEWCAGRAGEIVFLLDNKDYTSTLKVEQYDSENYDGEVIVNQTATKGNGVNIVFMGDCFDAKDIATGKYLDGINEAIGYYFDIEPYNSYKEYFNIYTVVGMSPDTGMGTVNTIKDAKFGSQYSLNGIEPNTTVIYDYAMKASTVNEDNLSQTLIVMVENTSDYGGICYMWGDGSAIAVCPMSRDAYPYDFRGIVQHEAGGHGFAKLGDEYIYTNAFIESCACANKHLDSFDAGKQLGWYRNLSTNGDMNTVEWSHLILHPDYSNIVDMYEGGYFHTRGIYRSEATSCMNNNIPYYSAIQRLEMVERIMRYAGEEFDIDAFYAKDVRDASNNNTLSRSAKPSFAEQASARKQMAPRIMGNKPILK